MNKTILLLISLILIPVVILGWLAARLETNQQALLSHQIEGLVEIKLEEIDQQFQNHFQRLEQALNAESQLLLLSKDTQYPEATLKTLSQSSPYIEQVFVISAEGTTLFPSESSKNPSEIAFLQSTKRLRSSPDIFQIQNKAPEKINLAASPYSAQLKAAPESKRIELAAPSQLASNVAADNVAEIAITSAEPLASTPSISFIDSGWIAWFNNSQLQHIYWRKDSDGALLGFSINSARLLSDLINSLPSSNGQDNSNQAIALINSRGEVHYEWGDSTIETQQLKPLDNLPLSHPLGSWKLEYYSPNLAKPTSNWIEKLSILSLTLSGLLILAWLIYRELTRTTRLAEQRVNFVNQVSHELKTPLTNVRMYAEMLERKLDDDDSKAQRYLSVINSESQRLSRLIENVLTFSKIGKEPKPLHLQPGTLKECIEHTVDVFMPSLTQHGLSVELDLQCDKQVMLDQNCIEQILNNLLSNCEKYAPQTGAIQIRCYSDNQQSYIEVEDAGEGISESLWESVFSPFYRISNKLSDGVSGTGIGLSIAREMARKHGGDLVIIPSKLGTCFRLELHTPDSYHRESKQ